MGWLPHRLDDDEGLCVFIFGCRGWVEARSGERWKGMGTDRAALHPGWRWRRLGEVRRRGGWTNVSSLVLYATCWALCDGRLRPTSGPAQLRWGGGRGRRAFVLGGRVVGRWMAGGGRIETRCRVLTGWWVATSWGVAARWGVPPGQGFTVTGWLVHGVFGRLGSLRCFGRFGHWMTGGVRVGVVRLRNFDGRGKFFIVGNFVEEDIILKGRADVCMERGLFGEEHLQANSDSILMWKYGRVVMQQCRDSHRGRK